jgi:murein DD-endopeptidase MepM/ murein hydrolase activator NlpD
LSLRFLLSAWRWLAGCAVLLVVASVCIQFFAPLPAAPREEPQRLAPPVDPTQVFTDTLGRDGSISLSLRKHRIPDLQIAELTQALRKVFNPRRHSRPGDYYTLVVDTAGTVQRFEYIVYLEPERPVLVERQGPVLRSRRLELPLTTRQFAVRIHIEDNLARAVRAAGEEDAFTDLLADDIFSSAIDFHKDPRRGDQVGIVYEKLYRDDRFVRYGRILLAQYQGEQVSSTAVYYQDPTGERGYYDGQGNSLERMFLLRPLSFRRISSGFNRRRFHPILQQNLPHLGTDYSAASGTPVWATARGRVVFAGWKGGYGKLVELEHPNGYRTRYGHLSQIAVSRNQVVRQQQVVGLVGSTGRSTGPHLHYELIRQGQHLNPISANKNARSRSLPPSCLQAFAEQRDRFLETLRSHTQPDQMPVAQAPVLIENPAP